MVLTSGGRQEAVTPPEGGHMQIKKPAREGHYSEVPRFENANYATEATDQLGSNADDSYSPRPMRQPNREVHDDGGDKTQAVTRSESVIDRHSSFDGRFETEHDLRVEGSVTGEVICRGLLTVEREAIARTKVQARDAHIHGRLEGDVVCSGRLLLSATAHVTGTFKAAVLVVEEGATVSGSVDTTQQNAAPARVAPALAASAPPADEAAAAVREPATVTRARRDLPSFAIVASDERATADRN